MGSFYTFCYCFFFLKGRNTSFIFSLFVIFLLSKSFLLLVFTFGGERGG
jgi:hypothetical protein